MTIALKPCPFCGSEEINIWSTDNDGYCAACSSCQAEGPFGLGVSGATKLWNKRNNDSQSPLPTTEQPNITTKLFKLVPIQSISSRTGKSYIEQIIIYDKGYPFAMVHIDLFWMPESRDIYDRLNRGETVLVNTTFEIKEEANDTINH